MEKFKEIEKVTSENLHKFYRHPEYNLFYMVQGTKAHYELLDRFSEIEVRRAIVKGVKIIAVYHAGDAILPADIINY